MLRRSVQGTRCPFSPLTLLLSCFFQEKATKFAGSPATARSLASAPQVPSQIYVQLHSKGHWLLLHETLTRKLGDDERSKWTPFYPHQFQFVLASLNSLALPDSLPSEIQSLAPDTETKGSQDCVICSTIALGDTPIINPFTLLCSNPD